MKIGKNAPALLALMALGLNFSAYAQEDTLLSETDQVVNTDQIDIEGLYKQKKKQPTQADRIQALRRKLEEKHEQMMRKKVEDMRLAEERKLAKKLEAALSGQMQAMDQVSTTYSAPAKVQAPAPAPAKVENKKNSFIISGGFMNIASEKNDLDANFNMKLSLENMVNERVAIGVGLRYVSIKMTDGENNYLSTPINSFGYANSYNSQYQNGREISYKQISFGAHGKVFLSVDSKIRPFVGAGIAYNRGNFNYEQNETFQYNGQQFGNEEVGSNNISGSALAGAAVQFSPMFSAEISVQYEKAFTSGVSQEDSLSSPDETRLRNLARDIEEADVASVNVGLSFNF